MKQKLLVSVSGGRTSALMAKLLWDRYRDKYDMIFVFANTSREREKTLIFVDQLTTIWGIPIVWVEALVNPEANKGTTHTITNFKDAKRNGEVFESVIQKYGIPNMAFLHCTRELKAQPIKDYARSIGWTDYTTVIGYRADEPKRINLVNAAKNKQWYPLYEWRIFKQDVAMFFINNNFDLQLKDYEGNCKVCHKKSKRKLLTSLLERPQDANWVIDMEAKYSQVKTSSSTDDKPIRFFRNNESIFDLIEESKRPFKLAIDQSLKTDKQLEFDYELDEQESCSESCEPF